MSDAPAGETIGVAVVGTGGWGTNHVRSLASLPEAELRWVCDRDEEARQEAARSAPVARTTGDLDDLLADEGVRGVVVATDAPSHAEIARRVLRSGRDVLVEKPLALTGDEAEQLCSLADGEGRVLMTGHLLLYHPAVEALRGLVDDGELGDVLYLTSQRTNLGVVRSDENAWWSLAPHDLSVATYLLGAEPGAVSASGACFLQKDKGIEDVVFATVEYPDGRLAHVHVSWLDPHKSRRLTVVGSRKMAVFDDTSADQKLSVFDKGVEAPPAAVGYAEGVRVRTGNIVIPALRMSEPLRREHEAFVRAVRTRERPRADGRSGVAVVRGLEAGSRSLAEGGARVVLGSGG